MDESIHGKLNEGSQASHTSNSQKQKRKKKKEKKLLKTGVVYIKHIPHGFYEDEMKGFFSQFGKVTRVCVARSPKTGNSKGFGYVQFVEEDVAKIAAETMNNYLMFEKIVKCKVLPPEKVTSATFGSASRRPGRNCPGQRRAARALQLLAARKGASQKRNAQRRREAAQRRTVLRLAQLGIKYDLSGGLVQEIEPASATDDTPASPASPAAGSPQLPVMHVDESDDEVTFKTPPNVIKRRLSRPAASTPQSAARTPITTAASGQPHQATTSKSAAKTTNSPAKTAKSPKIGTATPKTPKTPKAVAKKTPPKSAKQRSAGKKSAGKKTPPRSGRKR